jgi:hypothetical protein
MAKRTTAEPLANKEAFSVSDLTRLSDLSKGFLRLEIRRGALRARRFGRRILVLRQDWDRYLQAR